jgi:hypothetical protein
MCAPFKTAAVTVAIVPCKALELRARGVPVSVSEHSSDERLREVPISSGYSGKAAIN